MPTNVIDNLRDFNRKERFFLIGMALGNPRFSLSDQFRHLVNTSLRLKIAEDAFAAMDYHIDWIYASLFLASQDADDEIYSNELGLIKATQEDIDFLIAYRDGDKCHLVMLEAKGVTGFTNQQLQSKVKRLVAIFGNGGDEYLDVVPHFAIVSPKVPSLIHTNGWPSWMLCDGKIPWIEMPIPDGLKKISRCNQNGKSDALGSWWTVLPERKSAHR